MPRLHILLFAIAAFAVLTASASATVLNPGDIVTYPIIPIKATDAAPIVIEADMYDMNASRATFGIRASGGSSAGGIVDMGVNPTSYGFQTAYIGGPSSWTALTTADLSDQWNHWKATLGGTYATFELTSPGGVVWSLSVATPSGSFGYYDQVRMSMLSTATGGAAFENITVTQLPEPASVLMLLPSLALLRRRSSQAR